jgi:glycosyltransferase involved in cell wall biosynthesis
MRYAAFASHEKEHPALRWSTRNRNGLGGAPVRVARIIARLNVGGPAIHVTSLTSRLPAGRFESRLYAGDVSPGEAEMVEVLEREGVSPVRVPGLGRALRGHNDSRALLRLVMELRRFRPHIVHTHTAKGGTLGRIAARLCGVPIVVHTFHGHVFEGYFSPPVARVFVGIERGLARVTDAIVTLSRRQREDINDRYGIVPRYRTYVVPLGFDLGRFDGIARLRGQLRAELGIGDARLLTIVGRLTPIKDHPLLFEAMTRLGPEAHLCVVGGGESEQDLRALATRLGISARTHFLGFRTDLERILADTDAVVLTSRNEGTPVALIEALVAGCATVGPAVGGVPDVLQDGKWGILFENRSPDAVAQALRQALHARERQGEENVERARRYALDKYGIERLVSDHVQVYEELLGRAGIE